MTNWWVFCLCAPFWVCDPNATVDEVMITDYNAIPVDMNEQEVAQLFERLDLVSAPVIDENASWDASPLTMSSMSFAMRQNTHCSVCMV